MEVKLISNKYQSLKYKCFLTRRQYKKVKYFYKQKKDF